MSDAAIANIVTGIVTVSTLVIGFFTLWVKLKYGVEKTEEVVDKAHTVERKLDDNTLLTRAATEAAARSAVAATKTASEAKAATDEITKKLNGGVDSAIDTALRPIREMVAQNTKKLEELEDYVHERNHHMLDTLQTQATKVEQILRKLS